MMRILRESALFEAVERPHKPIQGVMLGDSGYMLRDWLMTPILNPGTRQKERYNSHHSLTRSTVERSIRVARRRWHCLRCCLRLDPVKASKVITVCPMLHNRASILNLPPPDDSDSEDEYDEDERNAMQQLTERARFAAGTAVRSRLIDNFFR